MSETEIKYAECTQCGAIADVHPACAVKRIPSLIHHGHGDIFETIGVFAVDNLLSPSKAWPIVACAYCGHVFAVIPALIRTADQVNREDAKRKLG